MLTSLHIRNFAIVDSLDLEFGPGLSVLTGETGAGKSILVDALAMVLGERASATDVRDSGRRSEVSAQFDLSRHGPARNWLAEREIEPLEECLVRRVIGTDGRSRAFINGSPVAVQDLRALGDLLVDIHGQHAHHALLKTAVQRELVDNFGGHRALLDLVRQTYDRWRALETELAQTGGDPAQRGAEIELLRFQIGELAELAVEPGEAGRLEDEQRRLANAGRLHDTAAEAYESLYGDDGAALPALETAVKQLALLAETDGTLAPIRDLLNEAAIQLREGDRELRGYVESVDLDPDRLARVEQRLDDIHQRARKHHAAADELPRLLAEFESRLERLEHSSERRDELIEKLSRVRREYGEQADRLTAARHATAGRLAEAITADLHNLGISSGRIEVAIAPLPEGQHGTHGRDRVELMVTTNPGRPPGPLSRIASGGELSRISLAIQVVGSRDHGIPTLVFDEVDVGIGGAVAEMVGNQLRSLATSRQVLCVTHLPQVASQGHNHLRVVKAAKDGSTRVHVEALGSDDRVEEVARMLGGLKITAQTRAHASEMIERYVGG